MWPLDRRAVRARRAHRAPRGRGDRGRRARAAPGVGALRRRACSTRRRSTAPTTRYAPPAGVAARHGEALGHMLAVMQSVAPRAPGGHVVSDASTTARAGRRGARPGDPRPHDRGPRDPARRRATTAGACESRSRRRTPAARRSTRSATPSRSRAADAGFADVEVVLQLKPAWTTRLDERGRAAQAARLRDRAAVGPRDRLPARAGAGRVPALRLGGRRASSPASARRRARPSTLPRLPRAVRSLQGPLMRGPHRLEVADVRRLTDGVDRGRTSRCRTTSPRSSPTRPAST